MDSEGNIYAFDECSILHLCKLNIKSAFKIFFQKDFIAHKNFEQLNKLLNYLRDGDKIRARFVPNENFEHNLFKSYNELLEKEGNVQMLGTTFKKEMLEQLEMFYEELSKEFRDIEKDENIKTIKPFFINNQKPLIKNQKIPEDDDLKIISAYSNYPCNGKKLFISEDEHFWGYSDLIEKEYGFTVVKEWECHKLVRVND